MSRAKDGERSRSPAPWLETALFTATAGKSPMS